MQRKYFYEVPVECQIKLAKKLIDSIHLNSQKRAVLSALKQAPNMSNPFDFTFEQAVKVMKGVSSAFLDED